MVIPSFEVYVEGYEDKYGIDLNFFEKCKSEIQKSLTLSDEKERTRLHKKVKNNIIEEKLIRHKEEQLLTIAHLESTRRGEYLIYKYYNGQYGIYPEGMRIPSKASSFYTKRDEELLKKMRILKTDGTSLT